MNSMPILLEARHSGEWHPVRIAREFPNAHAALNSLSMFARQQKVAAEDVRVRALRTEERLTAAEHAVEAYNTRIE